MACDVFSASHCGRSTAAVADFLAIVLLLSHKPKTNCESGNATHVKTTSFPLIHATTEQNAPGTNRARPYPGRGGWGAETMFQALLSQLGMDGWGLSDQIRAEWVLASGLYRAIPGADGATIFSPVPCSFNPD